MPCVIYSAQLYCVYRLYTEYNPVLCTQILVSPSFTINTEPQQIVSVN